MPSPPIARPPVGQEGLTTDGLGLHDASFVPGTVSVLDAAGEVRPLEDIEADTIRFALTHYRGQMSEVARKLRIGRSTLYRKLDSLGLAHSASDSDVAAE